MAGNIKTYTVDASFILAFLIPSEKTTDVDEVFDDYSTNKVRLISTSLLPYEVFNGLKAARLQKKLSPKTASILGAEFLNLKIEIKEVDFMKAYFLANEKKLSVYDASYLLLTKNTGSTLLTFDKQLKTAC